MCSELPGDGRVLLGCTFNLLSVTSASLPYFFVNSLGVAGCGLLGDEPSLSKLKSLYHYSGQ